MNPDVKAAWLAALRSGNYTQGKECLKRVRSNGDTEYCCLGVLCDILGRIDESRFEETDLGGKVYFFDLGTLDGPHRMGDLVGFDLIPSMPLQKFLASTNDDGVSFQTIADMIEAKL